MRAEQPAGLRLSLAEREEIAIRTAQGWSARRISTLLGRPPSTISRELARNNRPEGYRAIAADVSARGRAGRPKPTKLAANPRLAQEVQARLSLYDSPEQIAGRLPADFPDDPAMRISHETIYQELYVHPRGTLTQELTRCLRTGRALRRGQRRHPSGPRPGPIPDMVLIADRPDEVSARTVAGHWEGDLICGSANKSAIGTLVELTTSLTLLIPLPEGHTAAHVQAGITKVFASLPAHLRRSLTWDRGGEMAAHKTLTQATGTQVYFCDPHSPWQRPTNENTNGLLRQYFPKGTDLSVHSPEHIATVQAQFNDRPRKRLGFKTPAEAFAELLSQPQTTSSVAITP